jgi:dipeptidyl aminopeptidase/acylaminoacyl peptidase
VEHTDRFAGASANCPVINWLSFVGTTDGIGWYNNFDNYPWDDPSEHLRRSPLMYVGNVTTPVDDDASHGVERYAVAERE